MQNPNFVSKCIYLTTFEDHIICFLQCIFFHLFPSFSAFGNTKTNHNPCDIGAI